jgi:hypothetical protein
MRPENTRAAYGPTCASSDIQLDAKTLRVIAEADSTALV